VVRGAAAVGVTATADESAVDGAVEAAVDVVGVEVDVSEELTAVDLVGEAAGWAVEAVADPGVSRASRGADGDAPPQAARLSAIPRSSGRGAWTLMAIQRASPILLVREGFSCQRGFSERATTRA
jgi:hypothetical protein